MLQSMQKKVTEEGEKEEKLYEKFECYCRTGGGDLQASIAEGEMKGPAVSSDIEASENKLAQTKAELKQAQVDRSAAKSAMAEATALREKEAAAYAAEKADYDANIAAVRKAVAALEKGMAGSFLQTAGAEALRRVVLSKQAMLDVDRQELLAFLSGKSDSDYSPKSGEITGILKELGETMEKSLAEATAAEEAAVKSHEELLAAKSKEVAALSAAIELKTGQVGELGVKIVQLKEELSDTEAALAEDTKFLANLKGECETKKAEWEERKKTRAEELVALAETIKVLNDDDALDLFKKTLPSPAASFVQMRTSTEAKRAHALELLWGFRAGNAGDRAGLEMIALALAGKKALSQGGFDKVLKMIDNMVAVLKQEQKDDDNKKDYCAESLDTADDKKKALEHKISDAESAIERAQEGIATLTEEISSLEKGIKALDKSVAEATEQRKQENEEYKQEMASNAAAKELLEFAKRRLNKFYNPALVKPEAKPELSEADQIAVNMGGTAPPTPAPGGIAGTGISFAQVSAHNHARRGRDAPAPPPETWDAYAKKSEESMGVISMITLLVRDLDKDMAEADTTEKDAQAGYLAMMQDSAEKRAMDVKMLSRKAEVKAGLEGELTDQEGNKAARGKELMATAKYIQSLHSECDWLMQYYDVRKEARASEVDSLVKAKAILNGADLQLLQTKANSHDVLERAA